MGGHIPANQGLKERVSLGSLPDDLLQRIICTAARFDKEKGRRPGVGLVNRLFWRLYTDGRFADGRAMSVNLLRRGKEGPGEPSYRAAIAAYAPGVSSLKLQCYNDDYNSEEEDFPFHEVLGPLAPRVRRLQLHSMAGMPGLFPFLSGWPALEDVEVSEWGDFFDRYQSYWEGWPRGLAAKVRRLDTDLPGVAVVLPRLTALTRLSLKKGVDLPPVQLACLLPPLRQLRYFAFQELGCTSSDCDTLAATLSLLPHLEHCHLGMLGDAHALSPAITQLSRQLEHISLRSDLRIRPVNVTGLAAAWCCVWRLPDLDSLALKLCGEWVWPEEAAAAAAVQAAAPLLSRAPACLPALRCLRIESCKLPGNSLPPALFHGGALPLLCTLSVDCAVDHGQAEEEGLGTEVQLPSSFSTLTSLHSVALRRCGLQEPPPALLALPGLFNLVLEDNPLSTLPPGPDPATPWAWLRRLGRLYICSTPMAEWLKAGGTPTGMSPDEREMAMKRCRLRLSKSYGFFPPALF